MAKDTFRDPLDCLICELKDAYGILCSVGGPHYPGKIDCEEARTDAIASLERAFLLASDLKAAQS